MSLPAGSRLGSYEIVAPIGAGGMGEVYKARDTKLKRDVAIKILPEAFAVDPDRVARFQREAELLAAVTHPNIAAIYGVEETSASTGAGRATSAIVMELVEGETLEGRGALPLEEALPIARQIIDALEAAHDRGVVHRDLKPANIKITRDGTVKVLDFGLAKALESSGSGGAGGPGGLSVSPTLSVHATYAGVIVGTAAYMSPEQARGRPIDRRTDIWSFGCVLFELLSGARAFDGEDVAETIGAIIHKEPAWDRLPAGTAPTVRIVLRRCLEKDPKRRLRDIGDVQLALGGGFEVPAPPAPLDSRRARHGGRGSLLLAAITGAVVASVAAIVSWRLLQPEPRTLQPMRFTIAPSAIQPFNLQGFFRQIAISPDGGHIAYAAGADSQLMIRAIDQLDATPVRGSTGGFPFFSPDGRWLGFFAGGNGELKRVPITGGPAVTICRYQGTPRGASWGPDETIVFATNDTNTGLLSVPAGGGEPKVLTKPDRAHGETDHLMPSFSPDGRAVFFTISNGSDTDSAEVAVLDLRSGQRKTLIRGGNDAVYLDAGTRSGEPGYLVYAFAGTLRGVRFDLARLSVLSDPVPIVEQVVMMPTGATDFGVSRRGTLVYVPGGASAVLGRSLAWVSRDGHEERLDLPPRPYTSARLSPDETRVALAISDQQNDVWIHDLVRRTTTRLTNDPNLDAVPIWSPDGQRIVFASSRAGPPNIYAQTADGTGKVDRLTTSPNQQSLGSFSPDGRLLVFHQQSGGTTATDLMLLRFDPAPRVEPLLQTPFVEMAGEISPDCRWIAYYSNESGTESQVYVRPFPSVDGGRWQISSAGGSRPAWAKNGKELFYLNAGNAMMAVPVETVGAFRFGNPANLFKGAWYAVQASRPYDVSRDGKRFLMIKNPGGDDPRLVSPTMTVVVNWLEELRQRVPTK